MNNVMVDLETLGNGPNSVIIAVGAVMFDGKGVGSKFYQSVDPQSCVDAGLEMDTSTVMWWMQQSTEARSAFKKNGVALKDVLGKFSDFIRENSNFSDCKVWGNGASFDNTILSNAYRKTKIKQPWEFWNDRCYRTLKSLYPQVKMDRSGTHHNALDDATSQAEHLVQILKAMKANQ